MLLFGVDVDQSTTNSQIKVYATISVVVQFLCMLVMASLSPSVWQPTVYYGNWTFIVDHVIFVLSHHQISPLHWAADGGHVNIVMCLIEKGAEVNSQDEFGVSE